MKTFYKSIESNHCKCQTDFLQEQKRSAIFSAQYKLIKARLVFVIEILVQKTFFFFVAIIVALQDHFKSNMLCARIVFVRDLEEVSVP